MIERRISTGQMPGSVALEEYRKLFGTEPENDGEMYEKLEYEAKRKELLELLDS